VSWFRLQDNKYTRVWEYDRYKVDKTETNMMTMINDNSSGNEKTTVTTNAKTTTTI
jgi:hypothetical protein